MFDLLDVPTFARIADYCGLWACSPLHLAQLWQNVQRLDLKAHIAEGAQPLKSAIEKQSAGNGQSIAVLKLQGLLMKSQSSMGGTSTIQARRDLRQAVADPDVSGILLAIDSPGGTVSGTDDLASEVRAARQVKPVWSHIEDLGASAAYWIASQTDRVTANSPTALVGSIGTIQVIHDMSAAAEKEGVKTLVFATGALKGLGTPGSAVTDEQIAHVQGLVNAVQSSFDAAVKSGRNMNDKQLADVRHGGVMTAMDAMSKKLIDGVQPLSKTLSEFTRQAGRASQRANNGAGMSSVGAASFPMLRRGLPMRTN